MEETQEGSRQGSGRGRQRREGKGKRFPRRGTKNGEGPLRGWKRLERDPPRVGKGARQRTGRNGKKISTKGHEGRHEGPLRRWRRLKRGLAKDREGDPPRNSKERLEKTSTKGHEGRKTAKRFPRRATKDGKRQKDFHEGALRTARRGTKGLAGAQEGFAKGRHGEKGFPPSGYSKDVGKDSKDFS